MGKNRKNFLNYAMAQAFVITLGLTSMQDWIAYAKGKDEKGRIRPDNLPSNPWTVYKTELAEMNPPQKFNINTFIGCKLARKPRTKKADGAVSTPRKPRVKKTEAVADVTPEDAQTESAVLSAFEQAKQTIQALNLPNREAFYELKRKDMLPAGVPRKPEDTFKSEWQGWGDFLGNGNKQATVKTATVTA